MPEPKTIDQTPTWEAITPLIIRILQSNSPAGINDATEELLRMARLADLHVEHQKHVGIDKALTVPAEATCDNPPQ